MNPFIAFILGLLIGWLVEWAIDWFYWRRKNAASQTEADAGCRSRVAELEQEVASYQAQLTDLQAERARQDTQGAMRGAGIAVQTAAEPAPPRDRLEEIPGVTSTLALRLNEAGIYTFVGLAALRPDRLRDIAGEALDQPGSEVEIVKQARLTTGLIRQVDDLEIVNGIGPVIARILYRAGIFTFAELAALTPAGLREIVGDRIERLANEEKILAHARQLAERLD